MSARELTLPPLLVEEAEGGLLLLALQRRPLPLFHARLSLPAGASADPAGQEGLAQFVADLLRRGTAHRTADEVDELVEGMGASLSIECSADETALAVTAPSLHQERALDALLEVALAPSFPPDEVASARRRALAALQSDLDEPAAVASRATIAVGFGKGHPYGHLAHGSTAGVSSLERAHVLAFHAARYQRRGALLAVVGSEPPRELLSFARERLARFAFPPPSLLHVAPLPAPEPRQGLRALAVHKPESTQAQIRIVAPGVPRSTPRYAEAMVANTALGGGFTSLLVDAIRVDRGLSYSVASRLLMYRRAGLSLFSSFTRNETLRELVDVALAKMHAYAASGPTPEALEKTRVYLAGLFPLGLESHEALAEAVADALLDGLGLQHLETYRQRVLAASPEAVRAAAAELSPAGPGARIVIVGDGEVARRELSGLCEVDVRPLEEFA